MSAMFWGPLWAVTVSSGSGSGAPWWHGLEVPVIGAAGVLGVAFITAGSAKKRELAARRSASDAEGYQKLIDAASALRAVTRIIGPKLRPTKKENETFDTARTEFTLRIAATRSETVGTAALGWQRVAEKAFALDPDTSFEREVREWEALATAIGDALQSAYKGD